jgi:hypothetical protein
MAYEHGIAQKADGIPSWRERRSAEKAAEAEAAVVEKARLRRRKRRRSCGGREGRAGARRGGAARKRRRPRGGHPDVWKVADAMRSARGSQYVTEQIWAEAWYS